MATEQHINMTAQLYQMRRNARFLLGDRYAAKMADLGAALTEISQARGISVLAAAIAGAKGASDIAAMQILAAAVELTEPSTEAING